MPSSLRRLLRVAVGLIVSGGLLVYLFHDVDFAEMGRRLASTRWSFLAASVVIYLAALWSRARRWYYVTKFRTQLRRRHRDLYVLFRTRHGDVYDA